MFYQISSDDLTISRVGVLGFMLFMRLRSALVTSEGVIGMHGVCGWYGVYGTGAPVQGVLKPDGESGALSKTVCLVVCMDGDANDGSYARSGRAPPVRTAEGALGLENVAPGLGDAGKDGNRLTPGLGDEGKPTSGVVDLSVVAELGSCSYVA
jgi:hypothetical protein